MGRSKSSSKGKFIAIQSHLKKTRKISNKQSNLTLKATRERRTRKHIVSRRKEIKIRSEINRNEENNSKDQ